jgi:DNA-binding beta-propeller fold protein YncE
MHSIRSRQGRRAAIALAAGATALAASPAAHAAAGFGPLSGPSACLAAVSAEAPHGCRVANGLVGADAVAVSPDGADVYVVGGRAGNNVASSFGNLAILKRDPTTGAIGELGCLSSDGTDGRDGATGACTPTPSLLGADGVAVSADGLTVFVTSKSSASVVAFTRDPASGALARLGCLQGTPRLGSPCRAANVFNGVATVAASNDNRSLYVTAPGEGAVSALTSTSAPAAGGAAPGGVPSTVASIFTTPPASSFLGNPCVAVNGLDGSCAVGTAMRGVEALALSPDGKQLYGAAPESEAIDVFATDPERGLIETSCLMVGPPPGMCAPGALLHSPSHLAVSADGKNVYAGDQVAGGDGRLDVFARNQSTGALSEQSCLDFLPPPPEKHEEPGEGSEEKEESQPPAPLPPDRCERVPGLGSGSVLAVSGDGSAVYAFGNDSEVTLSRNAANGDLKEVSCASSEDSRCTSLPSLTGVHSATVSPDGREVYVTASGNVMVFGVGAAVSSARAPATRAGSADVRVACPSSLPRACSGRVELMRSVISAGRHGRHRARPLRVGAGFSGRFSITPGHEALVGVHLSRSAQHTLLAHRRVRLMAVVLADPSAGGSGSGRNVVFGLLHSRS